MGSNIINLIENDNYEIVPLERSKCDLLLPSSIEFLQNNIKDKDIIVFAAAIAPVKNWELYGKNMEMLLNFIKGVIGKNIDYVLNVSSDAVYSDSTSQIDENSKTLPENPHGLMHLFREKLLDDTLNCPIGHIRPTLIYGKNDPHNGYGPNMFLRNIKNNEDIYLFGKGEEIRDHISIHDVSFIAYTMIQNFITGKINAVSSNPISFYEIANLAIKSTESKNLIHFKERKVPMPHNGFRTFKKSKISNFVSNFEPLNLKSYIKDYFNE